MPPARPWMAQHAFTIGIVNDREAEADETIVFFVTTGSDESPEHTITIRDDDTIRVTSVVVASAPQSGDTYRSYETIVFTVTFSDPVRVTGHPALEVGLDNPAGSSGSTVEAGFWGQSKSERPTADTPRVSVSPHFAFRIQGAAVRPRRGRREHRRQRVAARLRGIDSK